MIIHSAAMSGIGPELSRLFFRFGFRGRRTEGLNGGIEESERRVAPGFALAVTLKAD